MAKNTRKNVRSGTVLHMSSAAQERAMQRLIQRGPVTIVFVYSTTCPHCHTYMPLWRDLCRTKGLANMVSMEANTYDDITMSETKPIESVPTVLFVDPTGRISEAKAPRNTTVMMNARKKGVSEIVSATNLSKKTNTATANAITPDIPELSDMLMSESTVKPEEEQVQLSTPTVIPGTEIHENTLSPVPGEPQATQYGGSKATQYGGSKATQYGGSKATQYGGNPWSAFLMAASQAAPAAVLLGAYAGLRTKPLRSSGLGPAKTRKAKRLHRFQTPDPKA